MSELIVRTSIKLIGMFTIGLRSLFRTAINYFRDVESTNFFATKKFTNTYEIAKKRTSNIFSVIISIGNFSFRHKKFCKAFLCLSKGSIVAFARPDTHHVFHTGYRDQSIMTIAGVRRSPDGVQYCT